MTYTIDCVLTNRGPRYRITLWNGRAAYVGSRNYARFQDAECAAKSTGVAEKVHD